MSTVINYDKVNNEVRMRTAKVISISLPPDLEKQIGEVAKLERRSISEVFREAFRQYLAGRDIAVLRKKGRRIVKKRGLTPDGIARSISEGRK
jgi:Arc/MetJ-type ribon-helix-helix transcriptional regulator